jgi:hypothetical protein
MANESRTSFVADTSKPLAMESQRTCPQARAHRLWAGTHLTMARGLKRYVYQRRDPAELRDRSYSEETIASI